MAVCDPNHIHTIISPLHDFIINTPLPTEPVGPMGVLPPGKKLSDCIMSEEVSPTMNTSPTGHVYGAALGDAPKANAFVAQFIASQQVYYKFEEGRILDDIKQYIDKTYTTHYGNRKYQATDMIIDAGYGESFCIGNVMKYSMRYGKKDGKNRADLLKIVHYAIMAIYLNELEEKGTA